MPWSLSTIKMWPPCEAASSSAALVTSPTICTRLPPGAHGAWPLTGLLTRLDALSQRFSKAQHIHNGTVSASITFDSGAAPKVPRMAYPRVLLAAFALGRSRAHVRRGRALLAEARARGVILFTRWADSQRQGPCPALRHTLLPPGTRPL